MTENERFAPPKNSLFRTKAVDFQGNKLYGEILLIPKINHVLVTVFLLLIILVVFFWLFSSSYARKHTVSGWLDPPAGLTKIYPSESGGKIKSLLVEQGDFVQQGQPLVNVSAERVLSDGQPLNEALQDEFLQQKKIIAAQKKREEKIYEEEARNLEHKIKSHKTELEMLNQQIDTVDERLNLAIKRASYLEEMSKMGHASKSSLDEAREKLLSITYDLQIVHRTKVALINQIDQLELDSKLYPSGNTT